jgi:hypothetical protein
LELGEKTGVWQMRRGSCTEAWAAAAGSCEAKPGHQPAAQTSTAAAPSPASATEPSTTPDTTQQAAKPKPVKVKRRETYGSGAGLKKMTTAVNDWLEKKGGTWKMKRCP